MVSKVQGSFAFWVYSACIVFSLKSYSDSQKAKSVELEESLFFTEIPTIVTATRIRQSVTSAPVAATIIDREMIEASGFTEIPDLLRLVPGFQVAHALGSLFSATYHGHAWEYPARLQVLVNGRSVYFSMLSTVDWDYMGVHINDIERIEVIRGPNAPAYGSNAFNGAINIITRQPYLDQSSASVQVGSKEQVEQFLKVVGSSGDASYRLTLFSRKNDGFDYENDHRDIDGFSIHSVLQSSSVDEINLELGYTGGNRGAQGIRSWSGEPESRWVDDPLNPFRGSASKGNFQNVHWRHSYDKNNDFNLRLYRNYFQQRDSYKIGYSLSEILTLVNIPMNEFTEQTGEQDQEISLGISGGTSERFDLDIEHTYVSDSKIQLSWGGGVRQDSLKNSGGARADGILKDNSSRIFANGVFPIGVNTDLNLGFIFEKNSITDNKFSPRVALNHSVSDHHSLRVSYAKAYRVPSLMEKHMNIQTVLAGGVVLDQSLLADPNLEAEEIEAYDIGYIGRVQSLPLRWEIKLFTEKMDKLISTRREPYDDYIDDLTRVWLNSGNAENSGIEGQLVFKHSPNNFVSLQFSHARSRASYFSHYPPWPTRTTRLGMPRNSISLLVAHRIRSSWQANLGVYRNGRMEWEGLGEIIDGYTRVDFNLMKSFTLFSRAKAKVTLGVQNLDNEYSEFNTRVIVVPRYYFKFMVTEL